uniref:Trissin n=1 Tax=Anopheles culicifacies TaxID=139723 RepID=A0A182MX88_9DIPT
MNSAAYISIILGCCVLWVACSFPVALSCDSCGRECASACGTRHFRTCCFNYLRKRSSPPVRDSTDDDKRLELWYGTKTTEQKPQENHRNFNNFLIKNNEGDFDYEYIPIISTNHLAPGRSQTATRTSLLRNPSINTPEHDEIIEKSSEDSQPGSLPLLYEA